MRLLADPKWKMEARKVRTLQDMQQLLLDFCRKNGEVVRVDKTTYVYA